MEASTSANGNSGASVNLKQLNPAAYLRTFLEEEVRPDARAVGDWRQTSINTGSLSTADGSALVRMGETAVLCGVTAQVAEPTLTAPNSGYLVVNVDLPPVCSPEFTPGPPSDKAQVLSDRIRSIVLSSGIVPLRSLAIQPGRAARVLFVDVVCMAYNGNIIDAALLAIMAALKNTQLPRVAWDSDSSRIVEETGPKPSLRLKNSILTASFSIFDSHCLADPDTFEESQEQAHVTIALDDKRNIHHIFQVGFSADAQTMSKALSAASKRTDQLQSLLAPE